MARVFSASISRGGPDAQALELLAGRGDIRVARLLGDLLGAGQDLVRLAAGLASVVMRSCSAFSRSLRACSASLRPCSIFDLALASIVDTGLNANDQMSDEEQDEVERADDHPEQVDLEQRRVALGGELCGVAACPGGDGQDSTMD